MTREEILKAYLEDPLFIDNQYIKKEDIQKFKWATPSENNLIQVLKLAIEGEIANESANITEKKINALLNRQS